MPLLEPPDWQEDLCWRIAARHDLDFFIDGGYRPQLTERGQRPSEARKATAPDVEMWERIVPEAERRLLVDLWLVSKRPFLEATVEEMSDVCNFGGLHVYLAPKDFDVAAQLAGFVPGPFVHEGLAGVFRPMPPLVPSQVKVYVSRDVPHGYYLSSAEPIEGLGWKPTESGQTRPEPDQALDRFMHPIREAHAD